MRKGICEALNGRLRDAVWNETLLRSLDHARKAVARWIAASNHRRPHAARGFDTVAAFAAEIAATGDPPREMERLRASPSCEPDPAHERQTNRQAPVARG